jgi:hypothetical protein
MKEFIVKVLHKRDSFKYETLSYKNILKVQQVVLESLKLSNVNELRDKFEGVAFIDRFSLKIYGIIAIENLLRLELIDWPKVDPKNFEPIIKINDQKISVIMSEYGEFPTIDKISDKPAIIAIKKDKKDIWICGFADVDTLNNNQDESMLKGSMTKNIDSKTIFVGFEFLKSFSTLQELEKMI